MIIIIMGVSSSGKSLTGKKVAEALGLPFYDADDFHPASNVKKMHEGIPLTDADRIPWLQNMATHIKQWQSQGGAVLACSALKEKYRVILSDHYTAYVHFIYLKGSKELIMERIRQRPNHFFPPALLDSQFAALEEPKKAFHVSIDDAPQEIADKIVQHIKSIEKKS
jgi:carbohydrate kinase (thermoresistant glucokinase family)